MKYILPAFLVLLSAIKLNAQNLVVNPSFEITTSNCANFGGEGFFTDLTGTWDNASNNAGGDSCSSPDLFSACNLFVTNAPSNVLGYQRPHSGTRYVGIITYDGVDEYREYIQGHLTTPLVAGQTYCVSMFVSHADNVIWATNNMGVRFSNTHYLRDPCPNNSAIYLTPQLNYTCVITDTSETWVRLQWNYVATGGEQYFIIGNFFNNANTTVVTGALSINPYAYYFIDDVSVVANACCYAAIRPHAPFCTTDAPSNLLVATDSGSSCSPVLNGTWSGTGITNTTNGTFSPAVAGIGLHLISYVLPCGYTDTMSVVVSPCAPLQVCRENNGNLTVSNGVGPYNWAQQVQQQDCSACFPGIPPFIQPCSIPPGCVVMVNAWQNFATGATVTPPGTYPLQVTDEAGTFDSIPSAASLPSCVACTLTASATSTPTSCGSGNGSATAIAGGGTPTGYVWSSGATTATAANLVAGNYTVTITSIGCNATATVTVNSSNGVSLTPSSTNAGCGVSNGSASVSATGGNNSFTYLWSNGGTNSAISNVAAGSYTVTVTSNGCTTTTSITVNSANAVSLTPSSTNAGCAPTGSATVVPNGGNGSFVYSWNNGGTAATISNLTAGNYSVTVTSAGCSATANFTINATGSVSASTSVTNAGCVTTGSATATPNGGTGSFTYLWSNGGNTATISNLAGGTYAVTVTSGSCTTTASATVVSTGGVTLTSLATNTTCGNNNGGISVTPSTGSAPFTYLWSNGSTTSSISNIAAGTYSTTVTDGGGCSATLSAVVNSSPVSPALITTNDSLICSGDSTQICVSGNNYTAYQWNTNQTSQCIYAKVAGNYYVTVTDNSNCTASSNRIPISVYALPPVSISVNGDTLSVYNSVSQQWFLGPNLILGATGNIYIATVAGNYTVMITDSNSCRATSTKVTVINTGINNLGIDETIKIYPNPLQFGNWNLEVGNDLIGGEVEVFDAEGRLVYKSEIKKLKSEIGFEAASGIYMMHIRSNRVNVSHKLIKL